MELRRLDGLRTRSPERPRPARRIAALTIALAAGVALLGAAAPVAGAASAPSWLVNTIQVWRWSPPSPDPSGLAYDSVAKRLIVVDAEVDEMSIYRRVNYYEASLAGSLLRTANTLGFSREPVGVAFASGRLFVADDDADRIYQIALGADGRFDALDRVTSFRTSPYGSTDPEGVSYDAAGNRLFIADGEGSEIYQVSPGDGVFGNGNDLVRHFDTATLGVRDPEAVEYRPESGTLFTIGADGSKVVELTATGVVLSESDTSALPLDKPAGLAWAPRSTDATQRSLYISDRKVDNDDHPTENDGAIYEVAIGVTGATRGVDVRVKAGSDDAEERAGGSVGLTSSDLEMVMDGTVRQTVGIRFKGLAIPAGATITKAWIQFVADEGQSEATALAIRAQAAGNAATFTTGSANLSSRPRTSASVSWSPPAWTAGAAGAAQRTPDLAAIVQEVVRRRGWASGNALAFVLTGTGHRTAKSFEAGAGVAPLLHVEYR
jgi:uncharacterized protein YjiK